MGGEQFDLAHTLAPYLDPQLVLLLLNFLKGEQCNVYDKKQLLQATIDLLQKTKMKDLQIQTYKDLSKVTEDATVSQLEQEKQSILKEFKDLSEKVAPLLKILSNEALVKQMIDEKRFNMTELQLALAQPQPTSAVPNIADLVDALSKYAKLHYDIARYDASAVYLHYYRLLLEHTDEYKKSYRAQWGKLAAHIMAQDFDAANTDLNLLKDMLDQVVHPTATAVASKDAQQAAPSTSWSPATAGTLLFDNALEQMQHRCWVIHWSLFVFFNHPNGKNAILDLLLQDKYLNVIQTTCPHILRYLAAAVIVNKKRRNQLKELARIIEQELVAYSDPILKFVEFLSVKVDFESALAELNKCDLVLRNDYFLVNCRQDFLDNAKQYIFESYCRIHRVIDVQLLATQLNMDKASAEKWIVNLIRNARYAAKIDSKTNRILMHDQIPNIYQHCVEKTEGVVLRTTLLKSHMEKKKK